MRTFTEKLEEAINRTGEVRFISYDGEYPNLCAGTLVIEIDGQRWTFPPHALSSGGTVSFDDDWNEEITDGEWSISEWPVGFPNRYKAMVLEAVNSNVQWGCCGGCV